MAEICMKCIGTGWLYGNSNELNHPKECPNCYGIGSVSNATARQCAEDAISATKSQTPYDEKSK